MTNASDTSTGMSEVVVNGRKTFMCQICFKLLKKRYQMQDHVLTHMTAVAPYRCTICNKPYTVRESYMYHMRTHEKANQRLKLLDHVKMLE